MTNLECRCLFFKKLSALCFLAELDGLAVVIMSVSGTYADLALVAGGDYVDPDDMNSYEPLGKIAEKVGLMWQPIHTFCLPD